MKLAEMTIQQLKDVSTLDLKHYSDDEICEEIELLSDYINDFGNDADVVALISKLETALE